MMGPSALLLAATLVAATPTLPAPGMASVVAGARACLALMAGGAAPAGWVATPPALARTDGQSFARDGVAITASRHGHGACWLQARKDGAYHMRELADGLATALNARQTEALGHVLLHLSDGRLAVLDGAQRGGSSYVFLRIADAKGT